MLRETPQALTQSGSLDYSEYQLKLALKREKYWAEICPTNTRRAMTAARKGLEKFAREGEPPADDQNAQRRQNYFHDAVLGRLFDQLSGGDERKHQILVDYFTPSSANWTDEQFENLREALEDLTREPRRNVVRCFPKGTCMCVRLLPCHLAC